MSMEDITAIQVGREIWDHPGATATMRRAVRRYQDRPALAAGETVTIVRLTHLEGTYGPEPRLLVANADGRERWIHPTDVELEPQPEPEPAAPAWDYSKSTWANRAAGAR